MPGAAQRTQSAMPIIIHGRVVDSSAAPVPDVEIRHLVADSVAEITRTTKDGAFALTLGHEPARGRIVARRLGFAIVEKPLSSIRLHDTLTIVLAASATHLESFEVFGEFEPGAWLSDFHRRRRDNSFGRYFTREEIHRANKHVMSELLRQTPGVTLAPSRRFGFVVRMRGCRDAPMIWLDGTRLPGAELDEVAKPDDIAAMEVYASTAGVPAQYLDRSNRGCGTILLWTRHQ